MCNEKSATEGAHRLNLARTLRGAGLLVKNVLFTVVVPGTVAAYAPWFLTRGHTCASGTMQVIGVALFGVGGATYTWCVWDFATFGSGTPLPIDAPKRLVVRGLYRHTRNPMYLGVLTVIVGWVVLHQRAILVGYGVAVGTCFHLFVVGYEEPHLRRVFGHPYEDYCRHVPRWVPGVRQLF